MDGSVLHLVENDEEIKTLETCPEPPEFLGFEAKCEWLRAAPELFKKGILTNDNLALFENYCFHIGQSRECMVIVEVDGKMIMSKNGYIEHPMNKLARENMAQAKSIMDGLKPKKLGNEKEEVENNWKDTKGLLA
jgi:P27 family predicted phage terminase small subunit